jgi:Ca2+-binding RTX toxin-like protein
MADKEGGRMRRFVVGAAIAGGVLIATGGVASAKPAAPSCNGLTATIVGTNGDDVLEGTAGADVIVGLDGNDEILASGGADTICAGSGDDEVFGDDFQFEGGSVDTIFGENGNDFIVGLAGADTLHGGNGDDFAIGGPGNDAVHGDRGNDFLFGNFGNDALTGGQGDDFLNGDLPFPFPPDPTAPPGAYEDPDPNSDSCAGGSGLDASTFCETESGIEEHPDPGSVVIPV